MNEFAQAILVWRLMRALGDDRLAPVVRHEVGTALAANPGFECCWDAEAFRVHGPDTNFVVR